ncbi:Fic family protein [Terrisporobacter vanillatitrophus]|uniref:Fic family protein n=1 Tax=Terrisporobacter vanillatitrophus TaxID=3058402 RepID=UPI003368619F
MNEYKLGLYADDNTELYYRQTIEINNLVDMLNTVKLEVKPGIDIKETLELESIYSSEVEGYFTTRRELSKFIEGKRNPSTKDEKAVYSNYLALKYGLESKESPYSKSFILKLNSIILDEAVKDYRKEPVDIVNRRDDIVHEGLPYNNLDKYMNSLMDFAKKNSLDPLISAIVIHFYFVYIHPFIDGNGRTGRAYSYLYLVSKGLSNYNLFSISYMLPDRRAKYYNHLKTIETNGFDLTEFIAFMLRVMIDGFEDIESKYNLINIISNVKRIYSVFKLEYTDLTETMLNFIYTKDNFNKDKFYKKIRSKFIKSGYTDERLQIEIDEILDTLVKYNVIDENYRINKNLTTKTS